MTWLFNTHGAISSVLHGEDASWHFCPVLWSKLKSLIVKNSDPHLS